MNKKILKIVLVLTIVLIGLGLRIYAVNHLPIDMDEPVYLSAALDYNNFIRNGEWTQLAWYDGNYEHPAFSKIMYAFALLTQDPLEKLYYQKDFNRLSPIQTSEGKPWGLAGRYTSVVFSTIAILFLAIFSPWAGLFLSIQTICIQYTSEIYLEALPLLTSLLSVLTYLKWFKKQRNENIKVRDTRNFWLLLSALFLGMTAASKYLYCVAGIAILLHLLIHMIQKKQIKEKMPYLFFWGLFSLLMFFVFDPYLWPHPFQRLWGTLTYHMNYHNSAIVKRYDYKFWQPFVWLSQSAPLHFPYLEGSFLIKFDLPISLLALIGLPRLFKENRVFFLWLIIAFVVLLLWPTKWPQYILTLVVPLSLSAAEGAKTVWELLKNIFKKSGYPQRLGL